MTIRFLYQCNICKSETLKETEVKGIQYDAPPGDERRSVMFIPPNVAAYHVCLECIPKVKLTR